jgi:hypothetical protein
MASSWVPEDGKKTGKRKTRVNSLGRNTQFFFFFPYRIPSIRWQQCQPSSRHARRKNNFSHFLLLSVAVSSYLDNIKQKQTTKKQNMKNPDNPDIRTRVRD